jgi:hypothetical protein
MAKESDSSLMFFLAESGDVEWLYKAGAPDLTTEQAMVIVHARGMNKIAAAFESLALAVDSLAAKIGTPQE